MAERGDSDDQVAELEMMEASLRSSFAPILSEFRPAYGLADEVLRTAGAGLPNLELASEVERVRSSLFPRLADDLRTSWLMAERGYSMQAALIGTSAIEVAVTLVAIGTSVPRARRWIQWEKPYRLPWRIREVCVELDGSAAGKGLYGWYRMLCLAKHANPVIQREVARSFSPAQHFLNEYPELNPKSIGRRILELYVPLAAATYAVARTGLEPNPADAETILRLFDEQNRIVAEVVPQLSPHWAGEKGPEGAG